MVGVADAPIDGVGTLVAVAGVVGVGLDGDGVAGVLATIGVGDGVATGVGVAVLPQAAERNSPNVTIIPASQLARTDERHGIAIPPRNDTLPAGLSALQECAEVARHLLRCQPEGQDGTKPSRGVEHERR